VQISYGRDVCGGEDPASVSLGTDVRYATQSYALAPSGTCVNNSDGSSFLAWLRGNESFVIAHFPKPGCDAADVQVLEQFPLDTYHIHAHTHWGRSVSAHTYTLAARAHVQSAMLCAHAQLHRAREWFIFPVGALQLACVW